MPGDRRAPWRWLVVGACAVQILLAAPLRAEQWQDYGPAERHKALKNYRRHQAAPEERRQEVERQYRRWREMPPAERERLRGTYERYRKLPPAERKEFDRKYQLWKRQGAP